MATRTWAVGPQVKDDAGVWHRPHVSRTSKDGKALHALTCGCGRQGEARTVRRLAVLDLTAHLLAVSPVAPDQRCRQHRQHRLQPWQRCELCTGQLDLLELMDLLDLDSEPRKEAP